MAALSEREIPRILGEDYQGQEAKSPMAEMMQKKKQKKDTVEERKFTAFAAVVMGLGLVLSAFVTAKGNAFYIQNAVAAVLLIAGVAWYTAAKSLEKKEVA
jgi:hypothetical protein